MENSVTDLNRGGAPPECDCPIGPGFVVDARNPFAGDSVKVYAVSKTGLEEPVTVVVQAGDHADTLELKLESGAFPNRGGDQIYASSWPPDAGTKRRPEPIPHFVRLAPGVTAGGLHAGETSFTPFVECNNLLGRKVVVFTNHKPAHWDWWGHSPSDAGGEIATRRKALYFTSTLPGRSLKVTWKGIFSSATPESAEPLDTAAALEPLPNLALEQQSEEAGQSTANGGAEAGRAWAYAIVQKEGFSRRLLSEWETDSSLTLNLTASARPRHPDDPEKEIALQDLDPVRGTARAETYHLRFLVESRDSDGNVAYHAITLPLQFQVDSPWRHYFQDGIVFILFLIPLVFVLVLGTKRLIKIIDTGGEAATKRVGKRVSLIPRTEGDSSGGESSPSPDPQKGKPSSASSESGSTKTDDRGQRAARESGRTKRKWGRS
ncbi:MAG: hypothetical protein O3B13_17260 [Planctomycetota bacterium]|nr:hypothetical protein [Planctomycetota bacterium]